MFRQLISVYLIFSFVALPLHAGVIQDVYQRFLKSLSSHPASSYQPINDGSPAVGAVAVQFSVNQMGAAQFNIPIAVSPGTADMAPQLSLSYNSQAPNATAGMGAGLQGLTSIVRCNADRAHNDRVHGVDYTNEDIYCLNGQQLVALNGAYGADGTEYRIYQDSFTKVISHGQQGAGPSWFTVYSKNGQIATYGNKQDSPLSQLLAQGKDTVAAWALSKISDRAGNYLLASYKQDGSFSYPIRVDYTGNDNVGLKPYNSVIFDYEDREDAQDFYRAGSHMVVGERLKKVTSYSGSDVVFTYQLAYSIDPSTTRSRLTGVTQCAGDGTCLKPVTFKWSEPPNYDGKDQTNIIKNDLLIEMTGSFGDVTSITYKPFTDSSVYTKGTGAVYPVQDIQAPMYVVAQTGSDDGVGGQHLTSYFYKAARLDLSGFDFLGFETVIKTDATTGISVATTYSQNTSNHTQQMPVSSVTTLKNGMVIAKTTTTWTTQVTGNGQKNATVYAVSPANMTKQAFELDGSLTSMTTTAYTYDSFGNATQVIETATDSTGSYVTTTNSQYNNDVPNWLLGQLDPATVQTAYGSSIGATRKSSFAYNAAGFLMTEIVEPDDDNYRVATNYNRDNFGNVISTTLSGKGVADRTAKVTYDTQGRFPVRWTNALGQQTSATYDPRFGVPLSQTDLNGLVTTHVYDSFGREVSSVRPDGMVTTMGVAWCDSSCPAGAVYSSTTQATKTAPATVYMDILGRTIAQKTLGLHGEPIWTETAYDNLSRVIKASAPHFESSPVQWTLSEHDVLGRVTRVSYPNGGVDGYIYQGLTVSMTDALGHTSSKTANVRGWMIKTVDAAGSTTTYEYDTRANLTVLTDSKGNKIINDYDLKGRKIRMQDPDMGTWTYSYDVIDELLSQRDANGDTTSFTYDLLGRMLSRTDKAGTSTWEYDIAPNGIGMLAKINGVSGLSSEKQPKLFINDSESMLRGLTRRLMSIIGERQSHLALGLAIYSETLSYDPLSRLHQRQVQIEGENFNTTMEYGDCSRVIKLTYPSAVVEQREYNDLGYLAKITDVSGKLLWAVNSMDALGHVTQEVLGNGVTTTRTFDDKTALLTDIESPGVLSLGYTYDLVGNLKTRSDGPQQLNEQFDYQDLLNRLTKYTSNGVVVTYQYDAIGNIVNKSDVGDYVYGGNGAGPHAVTATSHPTISRYTYDKNGNQLTRINVWNFVSRSVSYTSFGTPLHIETLGGKIQVDFKYDANRNRFIRTDTQNGTAKTTLYLGAYERITSSSGSEHRHTLGGVAVYTQIKDTQGNLKQAKTSYLHMGNLGSVEAITDESGQVIQRFHYDPFGVQTVVQRSMAADAITYAGFTGHEEIAQMNLIHMNGRMYDPVLGRFVTADPYIQSMANSQSLNRYSYVMNNPMTFTDPSGYFSFRNFFHHIGHEISKAIHNPGHAIGAALRNQYVDLVVNIAIGAMTLGSGFLVSALAESAFSAIVTEAHGGHLKDVLKNAAISLVTSAAGSIDSWITPVKWLSSSEKFFAKSVAHGLTGGALNVLQGKNFSNGFIAGATAEALSLKIADIKADSVIHVVERTAAKAVIGATDAATSGGNFVSGAKKAAFSELFKDTQDYLMNTWGPKDKTFNGISHWAKEHPYITATSVLAAVGYEGYVTQFKKDKLEKQAVSWTFDLVWKIEGQWLNRKVNEKTMGGTFDMYLTRSAIYGATGGIMSILKGGDWEKGFFANAGKGYPVKHVSDYVYAR